MNTSSIQFGNLINAYPNEIRTLEIIQELFEQAGTEYFLEGLFEAAKPSSTYALANILVALVDSGFIKKSFRVISFSDYGGIEEYASLYDIPESIHDWRADADIEITPANIKVIYKSG